MKKLATIGRDLVGLLGFGLISAGAGMIYLPAGLMVCGAFLAAGAYILARRG
jgi:hypothetical protein